MTKFLLVSDSHRDDDTLREIINKYPDYKMIHAGDSCLYKDNPLIKNAMVVIGNHDMIPFDEYIVASPYFICHGHTFGVYHSFDKVVKAAKDNRCHTVIHGHTHIPYDQIYDGIRIINPGSTMINRGSYGFGTYAILDTNTQELHFYHHHTHEMVDDIVIEDGINTFNEFRALIQQFKL